jgi:hypothetical protein
MTQFAKVVNVDELIKDRVRVEWVELGEGFSGYYDSEDPYDTELLRFDVSWLDDDGEWVDPGDVSYCTNFPASATPEQRQRGLEILMNAFYDPLMSGYPCKKIGEAMSWIGLDWLDGEVQ